MQENNEKVEDYMSLWKKKMDGDDKAPSVIGETLEKIEQLQKENMELRNKITENLELMSMKHYSIPKTKQHNDCLIK